MKGKNDVSGGRWYVTCNARRNGLKEMYTEICNLANIFVFSPIIWSVTLFCTVESKNQKNKWRMIEKKKKIYKRNSNNK